MAVNVQVKRMRASTLADRLGEVKVELDALKRLEAKLKDELKNREFTEVEGSKFKVLVTDYERKSVDYKTLLADYGLGDEEVSPYTSSKTCTRISVSEKV